MLFYLFSLILLVSAVGVVGFKNPINSALCLVLNMTCVAAFFAMLEAHFLATTQIIVYAGAVMVLVVFVLMLLNVKYEPIARYPFLFIAAAVGSGALFIGFLAPSLNGTFAIFPDPKVTVPGTMEILGRALFTHYIFPFEAASILIMAAVAGAVTLAKRKQ